jgi:hypothetical protein
VFLFLGTRIVHRHGRCILALGGQAHLRTMAKTRTPNLAPIRPPCIEPPQNTMCPRGPPRDCRHMTHAWCHHFAWWPHLRSTQVHLMSRQRLDFPHHCVAVDCHRRLRPMPHVHASCCLRAVVRGLTVVDVKFRWSQIVPEVDPSALVCGKPMAHVPTIHRAPRDPCERPTC